MRVLWAVNVSFPKVAQSLGKRHEYGGGWMRALLEMIEQKKEHQIAIVSVYDDKDLKKYRDGDTLYYLIPGGYKVKKSGGGNKLHKIWGEIIRDFKPDLVHIFGTEYAQNIELIRRNEKIPIIVSLQGILSAYYKYYYGGLDLKTIIFQRSLRDWVKLSGIIEDKIRFGKGIKIEKEILGSVDFVEGRTLWDRVIAFSINPNLKYYHCPRMLREPFYESQWNLKIVDKFSIYTSQAVYPIKGLHFLLEAISLLKVKYPGVKLYIAGTNICDCSTLYKRLKRTGYAIYINKLINQLGIKDNVIFTGILSAKEIADRLCKTHVFVLPSVIENSPNSLAEAMLLGVPCVASYVGGTPEMLEHNKSGYLYTYSEPQMLAEYISRLFSSEETAESFSKNAREVAHERHDKQNIYNTMTSIYSNITLK